jgi:hypothetical protein
MSHDGSEDPVDYTISNSIYELLDGKEVNVVADDLGWDIEDVMNIHPDNISDRHLTEIAEENYWSRRHLVDLKIALSKYQAKKG